MKRALFVSIVVALLGLAPAAEAQIRVDDGDSYSAASGYDGVGEMPAPSGGGSGTLEEARASGQGMRLGGGSVAPRRVPESYVVRRGDTLWDITGHFYGNPWQWPRVWSYNPEITNPHWIYPDDAVRLVPEGSASVRLPTADGGASGGPRVAVTQGNLAPGSIFLRDQAYLDAEALRAFGEIVGSPDDHMLLTTYDDVYIQFGEDAEVRRGMELAIFRQVRDDQRGPDEQGDLVRIFGAVEVRSYDPETGVGRAAIVEALDPIERGYEVANIPRRFEMVSPRENASDIDGEVVAAMLPLQVFGNQQIVFLNVGEEQGVQLGNRFFIIRSGDVWRANLHTSEREAGASDVSDDPVEYPDEIVAEGRVVNVRPQTSALMVTRAITEVELGDHAEMREGY